MGEFARESRRVTAPSTSPASDQPVHVAPWLAWGLCTSCITLAGLVVAFSIANHRLFLSTEGPTPNVVLTITFPLVGALVATRQPHNPLGWIFCTIGLSQALVGFTNEYAVYALWTAPGSLPAGSFMAWLTSWIWGPGTGLLLTYLLLLFPDGRLPSPRWRPVAWLSAVPIALVCGPIAILNWPLRGPALVQPGEFSVPEPGALALVSGIMATLLVGCGLACVVALVLRFRRSRGVERQQLKWFVFAGAITFTSWWVSDQLGVRGIEPPLAGLLYALVIAAIPVAAGIAILRYRLYDIDRLISRTLVYAALTVILGVVYAGMVLVLGQLFGGLAAEPPSWAVAGATLAVAALFQPARRRIQDVVDRRFNRRKYDAAKTIEAFSARLREQLDLDTLSAELLGVVDQTMQPTTASLWLRPPTSTPQDHGDAVAHHPAARPIGPSRSGPRGL
jgi:hypothetical protein